MTLGPDNDLAVEVRGRRESAITVEIVGTDDSQPLITIGTFAAFGPQIYRRREGPPTRDRASFTVLNPAARYFIRVDRAHDKDADVSRDDDRRRNGDPKDDDRRGNDNRQRDEDRRREDDRERTARGIVSINGAVVIPLSDFQEQVPSIERPVTLRASNELTVEVLGEPGSAITVQIIGIDHDPPVNIATPLPAPNANGWNKSNVTVSFTCTDLTSGVATCPAPLVVVAEGANQVVQGTAVDNAGNTATTRLTLNIDKTPPIVTASQAPVANANGWNNTPVVVTFVATDALSGVAPGSLSAPVTLAVDGTNLSVSGQATDLAGNVGPVTRGGINIDQTKPTITVALSPAPNANGWNNSSVTAHFTCTDAGSGIATCPLDQIVATDGANQTVSGTATDKAGNTASVTSAAFSLDQTKPTITVALAPPPNASGWNNSPVTAHFTCTDAGSGIGTCPPDQVIASQGANPGVSGTSTDKAGNSASVTSAPFNIDNTPPSITVSATPAANAAGWRSGNVTISFTCNDTGSGILSCPSPIVVTNDGANQSFSGTAVDNAGNRATTTISINVDRSAPTISATVSPPPSAAGWNRTPVTVTFMCADALSGIATCPPPVTVSSEGANQPVLGTATTNAGNTATAAATVNIDTSPPTITAVASPAPTPSGWNNTDVTVTFTCADALSGIATCPQPVTVSSEGANQPVSGTATDRAGNSASITTNVSIDKTRETIVARVMPTANPAGWNNSAVTLSFTCTDTGAGPGPCPDPVVVSAEGAGQTVSRTASDLAGNTTTVTVTVNVDKTPPVVHITGPADGAVLTDSSSSVTLGATVDDALSGISSVVCNGTPAIVTNGSVQCNVALVEGANALTIAATDVAGNASSASVNVRFAPNHRPTARAGGPYSGTVGQPVTFAGTASDPDNDPLVLSWDFGDGSPAAAASQVSHAYASAGAYTAIFTANDGRGGVTSSNAQVTVAAPVNHDPAIVSTPPTSATEGRLYTYLVVATDVDANDTLTFALTQAPNGMTIGSSSGAIAWTPAATDVPSAAVTVRVQDGRGGSATQSFTIAIAPANHPPVFTSTPVKVASEARAYTYQAAASDPDGDMLTFSLAGAPTGMTIGAAGLIAWTPAKAQVGNSSVSVKVADPSGAFATQTFTIAVTPNTAPAISSTPPTTATESTAYRYDVVATDADGDPLSFHLLQSPSGMTIGPLGRIDWTPGSDQVTTHPVTVEVRDDRGGQATQTFTIAVAALNRPPHIDSTPVTTAREGLLYNYQVHATDPNNDPIAYSLSAAPSGMTVDSASGLIAWTPAPGTPASVQVTVSASDGKGASDAQSFTIAVSPAPRTNQAPRITSTPDATGVATQPYVYDVHAEDPDAGDVLQFSLVQPPQGMTIDLVTGHVAWTPSAAQTGPFSVIVRVSDGKDATQQAWELTIVALRPTNHPPTANVGGPYHGDAGVAIAFSGAGSSDPDGDTLTFSWDFGDGSATGSGSAPTHVYQSAGSFVVTLTVTDGHGGESARSTSVAVGGAGDRSPPVVTLLGPREVLPGDRITLTAQASDNVKVEKVTFVVDGGAPVETFAEPFQQAITVPAVAVPGTTISVKATAVDPSGNAGSADATLTIKAKPDTEKPVVAINAPPIAAPGSSVRLSATASDNAGIQSVGFTVNGAGVTIVTQPPYEATYEIPANAPIGSALTVGAFALDFSANRSDASASITIVESPDTQPPTVQLLANASVVPGSSLSLSATAADNRGVSAVEFYVDGVRIATDTGAPYSATFGVPADAAPGRALQVEARAIDFSGLVGTDSRLTLIVAASSLGQGAIAGTVYDDTTGLPIEGAAIALTGTNTAGQPYTQTAVTNGRGQYLLEAVEGGGIVHVTRDGWTRVDRPVDIVRSKAVSAFDARLTPLSASTLVDPILGATLNSGAQTTLAVPTGAVAASTALSITALTPQGLEALLPPGWSVLAAADVAPHATAFAAPATLTLPASTTVAAGAPLALARWDEGGAAWRTVSARPADRQPLASSIDQGGSYVWVIGDTVPVAPPAAAPGTPLAGVITTVIPLDAATVVAPQSKILLYQPGVHADVTALITPAEPMTSGTPVVARITESYRFSSGLEAHPDPYLQDFVLYQPPGSSATISAHHIVTPSLSFEPTSLASGAITIELLAPAAGPRLADVVSTDGGTVSATNGERADIPANGLTAPAPIRVRSVGAPDLGFDLPASLAFTGGLDLFTGGAPFALPVTLSIPKPSDLPADAQILIARLADIDAASRLVLVAVGRTNGDRIESTAALGANADAFEGPRAEGRYLFVRPAAPVGFAAGLVRAINGDSFAGALVSADTLPLFALSRGDGRYIAAAAAGAVTLVAQDVVRHDSGSAQGTMAPLAVASIDLRLSAKIPRVLTIAPADQASNVPLSSPIVVRFSEPLNPLTITPTSVVLTGSDGTPLSSTLSLTNNNSVVTLRPTAALPPDSAFTVTIAATITNLSGYTLAQAVTSSFTSLDVTAPPPPPAGAIAASMPDANGNSTITATQGTANLHDTISILNVTRGTTTPVLLDPNGGFSVLVQASLTDQLKLKIVDAAGNATLVALPRFSRTNADGSRSVAIDAQGGTVDGPGGVSASIKPGTFPDGAIVTIKPVAEADFPVQMTPEQKQVFGFVGGVQLDFGGQVPTQYVNVSVPPGPGDTADNQWVVNQVAEVNGQKVMNVVDTAKLIDGRVTTSSPPCPGVNAAGVYGFLKSSYALGLTYGTTYGLQTLQGALAQDGVTAALTTFFAPYVFLFDTVESPMCMPVLSGRVTIVPNSVNLTVATAQFTPGADRIVVTNLSRDGEVTTFQRPSITFPIPVAGTMADTFTVFGSKAAGTIMQPLLFTQTAASPGFVELALGFDAILANPDEIVITNTKTPLAPIHVPFNTVTARFSVAGGAGDRFSVQVDDPTLGGCCPAAFAIVPSALGPGNLVARAVAGTIDPTQAEIDAYNAAHPGAPLRGRPRTKVEVVDLTSNSAIEVPAASITGGGFAFAFVGNGKDPFLIRETYDDGSTTSITVPTFRITVTNPKTGEVVKAITLPSPPRDQPLNLGRLTDDHTPPTFTNDLTALNNFDPSSILTFTFSESMDAASVKNNFRVLDSGGNVVKGDVRVSNQNQTVTFVPATTFELGKTYTVRFAGVTDRGGNGLAQASLTLSTVGPRIVGSLPMNPGPAAVRDIQVRKKDVGGTTSYFLVATTNGKLGNSFVTVDVTNPASPTQTGKALAGFYKRQVNVVPDVNGLALAGNNPCKPNGNTYTGDLAVTTSFSIDFTYVSFFDTTDMTAPCLMSNKILTATPDGELFEVVEHGTYHVFGVNSRGVATIQHDKGIAAYSAIAEAGLFFTDVGANVPEKPGSQRQTEPSLLGDYYDVVAYSGRLIALNHGARQLEVIDPSLAQLAVLPLPDAPRRLVVSQAFPFDANNNGTLEPGEFVDAVFIGGEKSIMMVDIGNLQSPKLIGSITMPAWITDLDVDRVRRRVAAVDTSNAFYLIDLTRIQTGTFVDANLDGLDDRISWMRRLTDFPWAVRIDKDRSNIYVGTDRGIDVYALGAPNLTGIVTFDYFPVVPPGVVLPALPNGGIDYASAQIKPVRGAIVELRDNAGAVLQAAVTDETGYYSFDAPTGVPVEVVVKAALGRPGAQHLEVVDNIAADAIGPHALTGLVVTSPDRIWAVSSGKFPVAGPTVQNIYAHTIWTPGVPQGTHTQRQAAPFAILDLVYQAEKTIRQADPARTFPLLKMAWSPQNTSCQPCPSGVAVGQIGITAYHPGETTIYVQGAENNDTDEYDDVILLHEWSHYFEDKFSHSDSIGGNHSIGDRLDPRLAFGEAFATAHALMLMCPTAGPGCKHAYLDSQGPNQAQATNFQDIEVDNNTPFVDAAGVSHSSTGWSSEESVREFLWDLFDPKSAAPEPDADGPAGATVQDDVDLGYKPIYTAMTGGERTTPAFTSIFSFMSALLNDAAAQAEKAQIFTLGRAEGMDFEHADQYEGTNAPDRLYTSVPADGTVVSKHDPGPFAGQLLQTRFLDDPGGVGNKLYEHVFLKFTIATAGTYDVVVTPTNNCAMYPVRVKNGAKTVINSPPPSGETQKLSINFATGDYVMSVSASAFVAGAWTSQFNCSFTTSITPGVPSTP